MGRETSEVASGSFGWRRDEQLVQGVGGTSAHPLVGSSGLGSLVLSHRIGDFLQIGEPEYTPTAINHVADIGHPEIGLDLDDVPVVFASQTALRSYDANDVSFREP
jgi:hypothetical protein